MLDLMKEKGYKVYERPYELNIVGVRKDSTEPNKFDDTLYVFWKDDKGAWEGKTYAITTDPGTYFLKNPINNLGAAILKEGQYVDAYKSGLHRGQYKALVQSKPVTVFRDYDRNAILDFNNGKEDTGLFGINIHKSGSKGDTQNVEKWSAGCQVFQNADSYNEFIKLTDKQLGLYGNKFTYTLVDERAYNRYIKKTGTGVILTIVVALVVFSIGRYATINKIS